MAIITPRDVNNEIRVKTKPDSKKNSPSDWWNAGSKAELNEKLLGTVGFLKELNNARYRQASIYARLYGNMPLMGWVGANMSRMSTGNQLPLDRPTMSVVTSCVDTLVSSLTQSRPRPVFLTDNGDYKQRNIAKQLNGFLQGEFYQTKYYELASLVLRDAAVLGTGCIKILEDQEKRVSLERRLCTELLVDPNDSLYGAPRQLYELKLVDREVLMDMFPKFKSVMNK